jgi:cystathionine beta-lyase/cystathionine gamma-synthase
MESLKTLAVHAGARPLASHATLAVDGTFSSPALQRTLAQGADYAVQSTTKRINGHSDAMGLEDPEEIAQDLLQAVSR